MKRILEFDIDNKYIQERIEDDNYEIQSNEYQAKLDDKLSFFMPILVQMISST